MVGVQDAAEALRIKEQQEADEAKVGVRLLLRRMASRASPAHRLHMRSRNRSKQMRSELKVLQSKTMSPFLPNLMIPRNL